MTDKYLTIKNPSTGHFKDRGSKFEAYAFPVFEEQMIRQRLEEVRELHPKARHHCYAFRLGLDGNQYRANDDGEPSGSAGRPILGQIDSFNFVNILVIVVRYFGGTKLGIPGLINAYKESTREALSQAEVIQKSLEEVYRLSFSYEYMPRLMTFLKKEGFLIENQKLTEKGQLEISISKSKVSESLKAIKAAVFQMRVTEMNPDYSEPGFEIEWIKNR